MSMKPLVKAVSGAVLLVLSATACASATHSTASTSGAAGSGSASRGSAPGGIAPTPLPPATSGGLSAPTTLPGHLIPTGAPGSMPSAGARVKNTSPINVTVSGDDQTLTSTTEWGGCDDEPQLIVVTQDAAKVVVEIRTTSHYRMGMMCPNIERLGVASVTLAAPLGSRQLVDGVTGKTITVR